MQHDRFMRQTLGLAHEALMAGEFPVAASLVHRDGIVATGVRSGTAGGGADEIHHAEIIALENYYRLGSGIDPGQMVIYSTMEPCLMCYGAILLCGIGTIVYAYEDVMGGATASDLDQMAPLYRRQRPVVVPGVMRQQSLALFQEYFRSPDNEYWSGSLLARYTLQQTAAGTC